ncbi:hypothetical protein SAMN05444365_102111 [Micromonospora pattaloongensis]|uniref:Uncharacterized protein n=1 Tax=Micromonospora pattaloongensis TaxID=405436 RepID=A0A1H3JIP0_9ACTN|nr:hypothetical protein [Micromonospora pattaloongensis]SDY39094.1 hypothetical protein SAMN05444365_102111 [Micromonospora pattaloongensis]
MEQTPSAPSPAGAPPADAPGSTPPSAPPGGRPPAPVAATAWLAYLGGAALLALVVIGMATVNADAGTSRLVVGGCALSFGLFFAALYYIAGRSLVKWGNAQSLRMLAGLPLLIGGAGLVNGVRRFSADNVGLLIGFAALLAYGVLLIVLPRLGGGPTWLAARRQWAAAEKQRRVAEVTRRFGGV